MWSSPEVKHPVFTADENIVQIKQVLDKYELKMMVILISTSLMLVCN